jgi:DNA-binding transcriptional LysR family regulator
MDASRLRYFSVIAQTESVRKAAEILNVSPSAISKALQMLEDELGVQLVTPLGRGIVMTPDGKRLAEKISPILRGLDNLRFELKEEAIKKLVAPLRIATFEVFSTYFLHVLNEIDIKERKLTLHETIPGELERAVQGGHVDVGVTYIPIPYPEVDYLKVGSIEMGVFKRKGSFKNMRQQDLPFVVPVTPIQGAPTRVRGLDGWSDELAYERKVQYEVTLLESALELCRQGRCAGYFPVFIIDEHNRKYKSEYFLERHPTPFPGRKCLQDVHIVKRRDRIEDSDVKLVAKMIRLGIKTKD